MLIKGFTVPVHGGAEGWDEVNRFLRSQSVLSVDRHFVSDGSNSIWAICVTFLDSAGKPSDETVITKTGNRPMRKAAYLQPGSRQAMRRRLA